MIRIDISRPKCTGCGICIDACPRNVFARDKDQWTGSFHPVVVAQLERCTACRNCEVLCPTQAITLYTR
jgi:2-oxoglutarate ferredoxin oxidoreductase subunit delta